MVKYSGEEHVLFKDFCAPWSPFDSPLFFKEKESIFLRSRKIRECKMLWSNTVEQSGLSSKVFMLPGHPLTSIVFQEKESIFLFQKKGKSNIVVKYSGAERALFKGFYAHCSPFDSPLLGGCSTPEVRAGRGSLGIFLVLIYVANNKIFGPKGVEWSKSDLKCK